MSKPDQRAWLAMFVDVADQPCLVVGGGAVAARKTRRLLAAGARVTLVAPTHGQAMAALVDSGEIIVHRRLFHLDDLGEQKLVVAATDDEAINTAIAQAARELGIPVNVAAPGHLSTVILPKVIDRAPVQIAVASGGASPALMRQLNRHLDAVIPRAYGELAALLAEFRDEIGARFAGTDERRRFHDAIIDGPVSEHVFAGRHALAREVIRNAIREGVPPVSDSSDCLAPAQFSTADRDSLYRIIAARRDMRHFVPGGSIEEPTLGRLFAAAHQAPSVGLMQPWRFIRVTDAQLRERIASLVAVERDATAAALGERAAEFLRLKVEGVRECAELLVVALAPDDGTVFGRRTLPDEMALCSVACAIQNLWLAARAENLGLGWVSMFDPAALARLLNMPAQAKPVAILCLGPVASFYPRPMLELEDWRHGRPLREMVFENGWGDTPPRPEMGA